ncbi:MAG TPA: SRPBCC family protein [Chitinophagaceae bacterium]|nr:SRPBCC family protein [Chitinophagaceae bacterium]
MIVVYILAGLIIALLLIAAFLPARYNLEQSAIIKRPAPVVMDKVGDFNYFAKWNPWQMMETNGSYNISGNPGTVGHQYTWEGKKTGKGRYTLTGIDNKHIHFNLEFLKPWKANAKDNWLFEDWGTSETKVTWQNAGELPYPVARLMGPMLIKNLQRQFIKGLNNLKKLCEGT